LLRKLIRKIVPESQGISAKRLIERPGRHAVESGEVGIKHQLTALRQRVGRLRTRTINKVQHLLLKHNLQQELPTKGMQTKAARQWRAKLPLGAIDRLELN
jgi:hypothetical protein